MQQLYIKSIFDDVELKQLKSSLRKNILATHQSLLLHLYFILQIGDQQLVYNQIQEEKLLDSSKDSQTSHNLFNLQFLEYLRNNEGFQAELKTHKIKAIYEKSQMRRVFNELLKKEKVRAFISLETPSQKEEEQILKYIFKKGMLKHESYMSYIDEQFLTWPDDRNTVINALQNIISEWYVKKEIAVWHSDWKEVNQFSEELLDTYLENKEMFNELIQPKLKNWKLDRVNNIDHILIRMGICELLFFPLIPIKVSMNEYIEISKVYSTLKSKEFINGILDGLRVDLIKEGKIRKSGRGLKED